MDKFPEIRLINDAGIKNGDMRLIPDSLKDKPMYSLANNWYAVDGTGKITKGLPKKKTTFYFK